MCISINILVYVYNMHMCSFFMYYMSMYLQYVQMCVYIYVCTLYLSIWIYTYSAFVLLIIGEIGFIGPCGLSTVLLCQGLKTMERDNKANVYVKNLDLSGRVNHKSFLQAACSQHSFAKTVIAGNQSSTLAAVSASK